MRVHPVLSLGIVVLSCLAATRAASQDQPAPVTTAPVRVHLASLGTPTQITLESTGGLQLSDSSHAAIPEATGTSVIVSADGNQVRIGKSVVESLRAEVTGGSGEVTVDIRRARHPYPDTLLVTAHRGHLNLVNETSLEHYTEGVLAGECPALFHPEAIKAMAVAARSYCYRKAYLGTGELCDTTHCQVYRGAAGIRPSIHEAVQATAGLCAVYQGEVIDAVYCSDCGGYTEANENAWKGARPVPYLRAVEDAPEPQGQPFCCVNRSHEWKLSLPKNRLTALLGRLTAGMKVEIQGLTESGRVRGLQLAMTTNGSAAESTTAAHGLSRLVSGEELRKLLGYGNLKSLRFAVHSTPEGVELTGHGFGHGVGLCQFGANGMGRQGYRCEDILKHYYTGIDVVAAPPVEQVRAKMAAARAAGRIARRPEPELIPQMMPELPTAPEMHGD